MIRSIYIKDFALIDELEVAFGEGLNILTGQTGAGKSIIIGALNMILGERADTDVIRQGAVKAIAEATMQVPASDELSDLLADNEIDQGDVLILRREIRQTGSRGFINDTPVPIGVLKQAGDLLVDLHGQHDHQMLLREENHLGMIDAFGDVEPFLASYKNEYHELKRIHADLRQLRKREAELREKTELYRFQVKELEEARLTADEENELEAEMNLLDNAELLDQKAAAISELAENEDASLIHMLNQLKLNLEDLSRIEPEFSQYLEEINTARVSVNEAVQFAERYRDTIEFNPKRLEELRQRQSELNRLQKKYQRTIPSLIDYAAEIRNELSLAENFDLEIEKLEQRLSDQSEKVAKAAKSLHDARIKVAERLGADIEAALKELGIGYPVLDIKVEWLRSENGWITVDGSAVECTELGADLVRIFISTNKGETPKPLARIASGGEISRVMLALKSILAREQSLPVMIFDEIDTGISGEISEKVGRAMRDLSAQCQIVAITHQPQIASQAHRHFKVEKTESDGRTVTRILTLDEDAHIREIAALMSGAEISDSALNSARELIRRNTYTN